MSFALRRIVSMHLPLLLLPTALCVQRPAAAQVSQQTVAQPTLSRQTVSQQTVSQQTMAADELIREARVHETAGEEQTALRLYTEALSLDPTSGDGYLGLASLRLRLGDLREAERVYSVSLEHVPALYAALLGRARTRRAIGKGFEAAQDLETYAAKEDDPRALRELARWYGEDGHPLAQLAVWRRLLTLAAARGDTSLASEARTMIRALQIVVHPIDPVSAPTGRERMRATIARIAQRGG